MALQITRQPRSWLTIWTHLNSEVVSRHIEEKVKSRFPERVKEIFITNKVPGYVFLRVTNSDVEFRNFLENISGVGGVLDMFGGSPQKVIQFIVYPHLDEKQKIEEGDLVEVTVGPLVGNRGRAIKVGNIVEVDLEFVGRLVSLQFQQEELQLHNPTSEEKHVR